MKSFAVFVLFLAGLVPAHADTWDVTASQICDSGAPCSIPFSLTATLTTVTETGLFNFFPFDGASEFGTFPVVTGMSGTFDGLPITFVSPDPSQYGISSFLMFGDLPEEFEFQAGGNVYFIDFTDVTVQIFGGSVSGESVLWTATDPVDGPEPSTFLLLTVPLLAALMLWARRSLLREYSA